MRNGEVRRENGHGVAEDQVVASVKNSFLAFRELIQTEETSPFSSVFRIHHGRTALDSSGIELEADGKSPVGEITLPDILQRFVT
jgi:hypothetical protein